MASQEAQTSFVPEYNSYTAIHGYAQKFSLSSGDEQAPPNDSLSSLRQGEAKKQSVVSIPNSDISPLDWNLRDSCCGDEDDGEFVGISSYLPDLSSAYLESSTSELDEGHDPAEQCVGEHTDSRDGITRTASPSPLEFSVDEDHSRSGGVVSYSPVDTSLSLLVDPASAVAASPPASSSASVPSYASTTQLNQSRDTGKSYSEVPTLRAERVGPSSPHRESLPSATASSSPTTGSSSLAETFAAPPELIERDWNSEFQEALDLPEGKQRYRVLSHLARDFVYTSKQYGKIIIAEYFLPNHQKTIKPFLAGGIAGGDKFQCASIFFKFALDTDLLKDAPQDKEFWMYGGRERNDDAAMKAAKNDKIGLMSYFNVKVPGLHFPLMAIIDFRGFRLIAMSILPISKTTIVYGSSDGGHVVHHSVPEVNKRMRSAGKRLNLKEHKVGLKKLVSVYGPGDIEVHEGFDKKFYVLDFGRVFPPEAPSRSGSRTIFYHLLRPEFVRGYRKPLSSDAFSVWGADDSAVHNAELRKATAHLFKKVIPNCATRIVDLFKVDPFMMENPDSFRLTEAIHSFGVNCRHLGRLRASITEKSAEALAVRRLMITEMTARALKTLLRQLFRREMEARKIPCVQPFKEVVLRFFNILILGSSSDESEAQRFTEFWHDHVKAFLEKKFPGCCDEDEKESTVNLYHQVDIPSLVRRVCSQTGVKLASGVMTEFDGPDSVRLHSLDVDAISARVRHISVIDEAEGNLLFLEATQSELGQVCQSARQWRVIHSTFERAVASNTSNPDTYVRWGQVLLEQSVRFDRMMGDKDDDVQVFTLLASAEEKFLKALQLDPRNVAAYVELARAYAETAARRQRNGTRFATSASIKAFNNIRKCSLASQRAISLSPSSYNDILSLADFTMTQSARSSNVLRQQQKLLASFYLFLGAIRSAPMEPSPLNFQRAAFAIISLVVSLGTTETFGEEGTPSSGQPIFHHYYGLAGSLLESALRRAPSISSAHHVFSMGRALISDTSLTVAIHHKPNSNTRAGEESRLCRFMDLVSVENPDADDPLWFYPSFEIGRPGSGSISPRTRKKLKLPKRYCSHDHRPIDPSLGLSSGLSGSGDDTSEDEIGSGIVGHNAPSRRSLHLYEKQCYYKNPKLLEQVHNLQSPEVKTSLSGKTGRTLILSYSCYDFFATTRVSVTFPEHEGVRPASILFFTSTQPFDITAFDECDTSTQHLTKKKLPLLKVVGLSRTESTPAVRSKVAVAEDRRANRRTMPAVLQQQSLAAALKQMDSGYSMIGSFDNIDKHAVTITREFRQERPARYILVKFVPRHGLEDHQISVLDITFRGRAVSTRDAALYRPPSPPHRSSPCLSRISPIPSLEVLPAASSSSSESLSRSSMEDGCSSHRSRSPRSPRSRRDSLRKSASGSSLTDMMPKFLRSKFKHSAHAEASSASSPTLSSSFLPGSPTLAPSAPSPHSHHTSRSSPAASADHSPSTSPSSSCAPSSAVAAVASSNPPTLSLSTSLSQLSLPSRRRSSRRAPVDLNSMNSSQDGADSHDDHDEQSGHSQSEDDESGGFSSSSSTGHVDEFLSVPSIGWEPTKSSRKLTLTPSMIVFHASASLFGGQNLVARANTPLDYFKPPFKSSRLRRRKCPIESRRADGCNFSYFEVTIEKLDKGGFIAVGLTPDLFSTSGNQPGWKSGSYGYHGDDGQLYLGMSHRAFQFPNREKVTFGEGDVIGCGIDSELNIFWTKNGVYLGGDATDRSKVVGRLANKPKPATPAPFLSDLNASFRLSTALSTAEPSSQNSSVDLELTRLYPTVGMNRSCVVRGNFGELPFFFDPVQYHKQREELLQVKKDLKSDLPLHDLCPYELNLFDRLALQKQWILVYHQVAAYNWRFRALLTAYMSHYCKTQPGSFDFSNCKRPILCLESLKAVLNNMSPDYLVHLNFSKSELKDSDLALLAESPAARSLESLVLSRCNQLSPDALTKLAAFPKLQALHLPPRASEKVLKDLKGLTFLNCSGCIDVNDSVISMVTRRCSLRTLDLSQCTQITDKSLHSLARRCSTTLRWFHINECNQLSATGIAKLVSECTLESFSARGSTSEQMPITNTILHVIGNNFGESLKVLDLSSNPGLSSSGFADLLERCQKLLTLRVANLRLLGSHCFRQMASLRFVRELDLAYTVIEDASLLEIAEGSCSRLASLRLRGCSLITSNGLINMQTTFASSSTLRYLDLSSTNVNSTFLVQLHAKHACMPKLQRLDLFETRLHIAAIQRLRLSRPDLSVRHVLATE